MGIRKPFLRGFLEPITSGQLAEGKRDMQDETQAVNALESQPVEQAEEVAKEESQSNEAISQENAQVTENSESKESEDLPKKLQERLGKQKHQHAKELRALNAKIAELQSMMQHNQNGDAASNTAVVLPGIEPGSVEEKVIKALSVVAKAQQLEQIKKVQDAQIKEELKVYESFNERLDAANEVYPDFDEVVRSESARFTTHMRDCAMILPNDVDVLYELGKNRDELNRIAALHPIEQKREMVKISNKLLASPGRSKLSKAPAPISPLKNNPLSSSSSQINQNMSVAEIRRRMKEAKR